MDGRLQMAWLVVATQNDAEIFVDRDGIRSARFFLQFDVRCLVNDAVVFYDV